MTSSVTAYLLAVRPIALGIIALTVRCRYSVGHLRVADQQGRQTVRQHDAPGHTAIWLWAAVLMVHVADSERLCTRRHGKTLHGRQTASAAETNDLYCR